MEENEEGVRGEEKEKGVKGRMEGEESKNKVGREVAAEWEDKSRRKRSRQRR